MDQEIEAVFEQLKIWGITEQDARAASEASGGDIQRALDHVHERNGGERSSPSPTSGTSSFAAVPPMNEPPPAYDGWPVHPEDESAVQVLLSMGFPQEAAISAFFQAEKDISLAVHLLTQNSQKKGHFPSTFGDSSSPASSRPSSFSTSREESSSSSPLSSSSTQSFQKATTNSPSPSSQLSKAAAGVSNELDKLVAEKEKLQQLIGAAKKKGLKPVERKIEGIPWIHLAVLGDDIALVRELLSLGADIETTSSSKANTPLLTALGNRYEDGSEMARYLLSMRANIQVINSAGETPQSLAKTVTARYWVELALSRPHRAPDRLEALRRAGCLWIEGLYFSIVGQPLAKKILTDYLTTSFLSGSPNEKRPLVLMFAGPSGHGKTALAERLAQVCNVPHVKIMCENYKDEYAMFGAQAPYAGCEKGSLLNNFLAEHEGKRCVVILDEFEKTWEDARLGFLNPFDKGEYVERRVKSGKVIDCSKTIFILTTNAADPEIVNFYQQSQVLKDYQKFPLEKLDEEGVKLRNVIQEKITSAFGPPVAGRIRGFVPFVPFSRSDLEVISDQCFLALTKYFMTKPDYKHKFIPLRRVHIHETALIALTQKYKQALGARSIENEIESLKNLVTTDWSNSSGHNLDVCLYFKDQQFCVYPKKDVPAGMFSSTALSPPPTDPRRVNDEAEEEPEEDAEQDKENGSYAFLRETN